VPLNELFGIIDYALADKKKKKKKKIPKTKEILPIKGIKMILLNILKTISV
jgi:hypothetical protein